MLPLTSAHAILYTLESPTAPSPPRTALVHPSNWKNTRHCSFTPPPCLVYENIIYERTPGKQKAGQTLQLVVVGWLLVLTRAGARSRLVDLGRDGERDARQLLLLLVVVLRRRRGAVLLEPLERLLDGVQDLVLLASVQKGGGSHHGAGATYSLLVVVVELATEAVVVVDLRLEAEGVVLKAVARLDALTLRLVLLGELLGCGQLASLMILFPRLHSPSSTMRSISSWVRRPLSLVMVIDSVGGC